MSQSDLFLVVIAGGSGTRFWPKSTSKKPKQLLGFHRSESSSSVENQTLLAQTVSRFESLVPSSQRLIVTTQLLKQAIEAEKTGAKVLAEPQGRNTAPCIYWAARHVAQHNPQAVMLVMPSDHYIADPKQFTAVVQTAAQWARKNDDLVTLGIRPTRPETGYGYLKLAESIQSKTSHPIKVHSFVEKPNLEKAKEFLHAGNYLWNGGMFLWKAEVILKAFDELMPEMKVAWEQADGRIEDAYPKMTATSIDFGVMEKAKNVVTFPLDCGWDDLGSWTSLESIADQLGAQKGENVVIGGELLPIESTKNIIDAPQRLVALLGVNNLIIVQQGETLLVANKDRAQDIRKIVDELKKTRPDLV